MSSKAAFLDSLEERTEELTNRYPDFQVFELTMRKLVDCIEETGFDSFSGRDADVMIRLRKALEQEIGENHLWALAHIDLWSGSPFHGRHWRKLVEVGPRTIRWAIQAAYYAWSSTGSDSAQELARLIEETECWPQAIDYLEELKSESHASGWVDRVLGWREAVARG